jgi:hypothetical protein
VPNFQVNLFVPNSTDASSEQKHLVSGFELTEDSSFGMAEMSGNELEMTGGKLEPDKHPPKTERCAVGFYQNRNRVLTATIINRTLSTPKAVLRFKKSLVGKKFISCANIFLVRSKTVFMAVLKVRFE